MFEDSFMIESIFRSAWIGFKRNFFIFIVFACAVFAAFAFFTFIKFLPFKLNVIIQLIVTAYLGLSFTKAALGAALNHKITFDVFKNDTVSTIKFVFVTLIFSIGFWLAAYNTFLIFGTIVIAAIFLPLPFIIVDEDISLVAAIVKSLRSSIPNFVSLILFILISCLICIAGIIALGIGELIALPVVIIAAAHAYKKIVR
ncbi:MAG: hypothetical protein LBB93_04375 [Elusimicrobiota bacterium]|jgi:uncharacterized membrane protein|nr:hypothetical protein [Elusimicrobiota bacterium]